ncbi:hypothetical protein GIB67_034788 [Kingdonia uniflora]|uniref:FAD/NAD(P)-binding domain-containing protein n=1 Tax=Kingdonia uniflora TaxID=39325 RepID=A0A7J7MDU2_9MAGN|nr:hypothetical protein GIB67_034788 [Kingdonia uniflora]
MSFLKNIDIFSFDVQVVSPRNYFVFTPLLPSVTCECVKIDVANKKVICHSNDDTVLGKTKILLDYDYLVITTGAQVNSFSTPGVTEHCHFLKEVKDAQKIRRSVISCFQKADLPNLSQEEKIMKLHFVIAGGGPTGMEFAAELHEFVKEDLVKIYPMVQNLVRIIVVQSGDHILNTFDESVSSFAEQKFQSDGIEEKIGCRIIGVSEKEIIVKVKSEGIVSSIPYGMVVWSAGT